jgi:hypothetical protein
MLLAVEVDLKWYSRQAGGSSPVGGSGIPTSTQRLAMLQQILVAVEALVDILLCIANWWQRRYRYCNHSLCWLR